MKKTVFLILALLLAALLCAGCAAKKAVPFTAENEIATYTRIDLSKTQLAVSSLGNNANIRELSAAFELENPDVQVICFDLTGGAADYKPVCEQIKNGLVPDVMFINLNTLTDEKQTIEYFEDLSTNPVIENFGAEALSRLAVDGFVYFLPAPSEINCILYNKTMFDQYGWEVPKTFDEFVALCVRIREDTNGTIQPWNPNAKYDTVFSTALEAFTYEELFGGKDNRSWYKAFCRGEATFAGHMEPFYAMLEKLIGNGILTEEHFNYSATTRGKEFKAGRIAMCNAPIAQMDDAGFTVAYMPYPTTKGGLGYVNETFSSMLCVPKKERTEKQRDAIDRYIAFFSSVKGQQALIGKSLMVSNVSGVPLNETEAMAGIEDVIEQGYKFSLFDFAGIGARTFTFKDNALSMVTEKKTGAEIIAQIDAHPYLLAGEAPAVAAEKLGTAAEDFTTLEFSNYIADMYREKAGADIGLINHGIAYRGNLVQVFAGDIYDSYMFPFKPRSFENGSTLVKASMTGKQLLAAINHPAGNECVSDSVYAFSGLRCEVAPWNALGSKYLSVKLADGMPLDMDKLYTAAFWSGTVSDEYITETLETYEGSWEELMAAKIKADGTIAPAGDGRIRLVWE